MERYLRAGNRSPRTIQSYAEAALQFDAWLDDQDLPVDAGLIERRHVEAWLASLLDRWKPATAAARYRSLRQFIRWLEDDGELDVSTMTKMRPPQVPEQPVPVLTDDQLGALLEASTGKAFTAGRDTAIIRTLLDTGGRLSEVARLKVDDVDFNVVLYVMGKGRRGRSVPFGRRTGRRSIATCAPEAGTTTPIVASLWLGKRGPMTPSGIGQMLDRRANQAGIGYPHQFRHTFAHTWLAEGGTESDLMRIAGWSSPRCCRATARPRRLSAHARRTDASRPAIGSSTRPASEATCDVHLLRVNRRVWDRVLAPHAVASWRALSDT